MRNYVGTSTAEIQVDCGVSEMGSAPLSAADVRRARKIDIGSSR
jgi:hypothetical protein